MPLHTMNELKQRQALPLEIKIRMTQQRIREWVSEFGVDGVYVSFSGGKDSTVLLHLVREMYPTIPAVFIDTGLEYPEIREFVKTFDNVEWIRPEMNFKQVINAYGYPFISKEVSNCVDGARKYLAKLNQQNSTNSDKIPYYNNMADIMGIDRRDNKNNPDYLALKFGSIPNYRLARLMGELKNKEDGPSKFNHTKYQFFLDAPFNISDRCCAIMKKKPVHSYEKRTGRKPIMATMAEESQLRAQKWLHEGCNAFDGKYPHSKPMSFWKNQDVLKYIKDNNIQIASVYGDVVLDIDPFDVTINQIKLWDMPENKKDTEVLKTTGCKRTGCAMCMFGGHIDTERIVNIAKVSRPELADYVFRGGAFDTDGLWKPDSRGLGYWFVMKWVNIHGGFKMVIPNFEEYEKTYGNEKTHYYLYES